MDKRGVVFFLAMAFVVLVVFFYALTVLLNKQDKLERQIGETQVAALHTYQQAEQEKLHMRKVAEIAVPAAVLAVADGSHSPCILRFGVPLWSSDSGECHVTKIQLKEQFDAVLNGILEMYGKPRVETAIIDKEGMRVSLVPDSQVLPIHCGIEVCGQYRFTPTAIVDISYQLDEYLAVQEKVIETLLPKLRDCAGVQICLDQTLQQAGDAQFTFSTECGQDISPTNTDAIVACAISRQKFWHYNRRSGNMEYAPVRYRFAVEI